MTDHTFGQWLSHPLPGEEVVISGLSGHLPESENVHEFQQNLFNKVDMVTDEDRRWKLDHPEIPKKVATIYNTDKFDPGFFGVHYRQAQIMDPVMRKVLETAVEAVIDAGINPSELKGSRTGVFVGACYSDMECETLCNTTEPQKFAVTGYLRNFLPHRISYYLKLKGPSVVVDTACSSSANALELAFKTIRSGRCDNAIVGGVNLLFHPGVTLQFARLGVLSMDGVCKVFDQNADGYVRSETIACVFLQKAKNARRIYSQIVSAKVNCDGFKPEGITFPSTRMQKELIIDVLNESNVAASDLSYLEAHGTGTEVGDPQEVEAIDLAIAKQREEPLHIGSVKSSIGHSEPASGLCSLIKVIIAMETGLIAPNINLNTLKKNIKGFDEGRIKVVTELKELEGDEAIVGINNFGFGGNNCHLVVRRFKKKKVEDGKPQDDIPRLVCVSGRTEDSVFNLLNDLNNKPLDNEYVGLLHQVFKKCISNHLYRGYAIVSSGCPIKSSVKLEKYQHSLFIFFGQFNNSFNCLGKYLLNFPIFESSMLRINEYLRIKNVNILDTILNENQSENDQLLAAVAVQIGFIDILKILEIKPTAVYGNFLGKLVCAYYYEVITLEDTIESVLKLLNESQGLSTLNFETLLPNLNSLKEKWSIRSTFKKRIHFDIENYGTDYKNFYYSIKSAKNSIILNVSDYRLSEKDLLLVKGQSVQFLDILGRLYIEGFNPQLHNLYPPVEYPVSRSTRMIAPLIKWNHQKSWYTYKFQKLRYSEANQRKINFSLLRDTQRYISGHVVDGRNLIPATEYLCMVWECLAETLKYQPWDMVVVFENCKFVKAMTIPKTDFLRLMVSIQHGTGNFEITEKNSLVVTGRVYSPRLTNPQKNNTPIMTLNETDRASVMEQDEIYKELYLRGYNYSGLFKGIVKCNIEASVGLIKWEDNWTTFMDKMLQMKILQTDSRQLYVPVGIKKLTIDAKRHLTMIDKTTNLVPVNVVKENNVIRAGGIEISGVQARSISRRKPALEPLLEKYEFVPNQARLDLNLAITVNVQIILENGLETNFKAVEIFDDLYENDSELLMPTVYKVLQNVPIITPGLIISTKKSIGDYQHIKVEDFQFTPKSNLNLIVGCKILERPNLNTILSATGKNGFILTREDTSCVIENVDNVEIITEYTTQREKIILFRKSKSVEDTKYIEISSQNFDWLSQLQNALKQQSQIVVYTQKQELSGIIGFVNCIRREPNGSKVKCFFMMDSAPEFDPEIDFFQDQIKKNLAINVYKNSKWGTYRHLLLEDLEETQGEHFYVNSTNIGDFSSLRWLKGSLSPRTPLKENEVIVYNYYTPINFKDVMIASGRISADVFTQNRIDQQCLLGFEFAGKDINGRRVMGLAKPGSMSTIIAIDKDLIYTVPDNYTLEQAATIPAVYSTVIYAFLKLITLKRGMSVLIHSAAGGVGLAAINVCLYYKCKIFVTVGTSEKKEYLRKHFPQIPERHIGNSRDTTFEQMVKIETKGRGVDIVLNSLAEEKLMSSIKCLARGGHFLEIGKYDLENDNLLKLLLLKNEISYHGVMLDQVLALSPERQAWLIEEVKKGLKLGYVKPLPTTVFQSHELEKAFKYMTTGKHIGKIVVKIRDEDNQLTIPTPCRANITGIPKFHCNPQKCYVIIGGLGGFGLELADWLVLRGAKNVVLVSSSGIKTGYQSQRIRVWQSYGVKVHVSTCDVTSKDGCIELIKESRRYGTIDAIFNLAVVLKDALFEDQTEETFQISLSPKAHATKYLDEVTRELCPDLRYFVVFSSVSCGRGNMGQTNYGMANSIMERICEKRKRDGFSALSIQWGAIGEVGLVAKMQKENKELVIGGTLQQKVSSCLKALDMFLNQQNPIVSSMIVAEKHKTNNSSSATEIIAEMLGIKDLKKVNQNATFAELGVDSMTGSEVIQLLESDFDISISNKEVRNLTLARIKELQAEKEGIEESKNDHNTDISGNLILQCIPDKTNAQFPIIKLRSPANDEMDSPIVFLLGGIEGIFNPLESVINNLNAHIFALQYNYDHPQDTIEESAKFMLPYIEERIGKDKKFRFISYSFGTVLTMELVALLESKDYKGSIILIEGSPTYLKAAAQYFSPNKSEAEYETFFIMKILSCILPVNTVLEKMDDLLKCANFEERMKIADSMTSQNLVNSELIFKRFKALMNFDFAHDKIKSQVYLFRAARSLIPKVTNDYDLSLSCENLVAVTELEGDHVTILTQKRLTEDIVKLLNS